MFRFCGRKNPHPNLAKNARLGWGTREFEFAGKFPGSVVELELDWRAGQSEGLLLDGFGILADAGGFTAQWLFEFLQRLGEGLGFGAGRRELHQLFRFEEAGEG